MSDNRLMPNNSVEFEVITTNPAWGDDEVNIDWVYQEEGVTKINSWKAMNFLTRDLRLGNLSSKVHDLNFIWNHVNNAGQIILLRKGAFKDVAISMLFSVASMTETSQSHGGFLRKNSRTINQNQTYSDSTPAQPKSFLGGWFK